MVIVLNSFLTFYQRGSCIYSTNQSLLSIKLLTLFINNLILTCDMKIFKKLLMIYDFNQFHELLINKTIKIPNKMLNDVVQNYMFINIPGNNEIKQNIEILLKIKDSELMIINYFKEMNKNSCDLYFIFGIKNAIIIINNQSKSLIEYFLTLNPEIKICFLRDAKDVFDQNIKIQYNESIQNPFLEEEIENFNQRFSLKTNLRSIKKIWELILPNITGYLISESYSKLSFDRYKKICQNSNEKIQENIEINKYIELRQIGAGSTNFLKLAYLIEEKELCVIKKFNELNQFDLKNLNRETYNYTNIKHPFIPKFYGTTKNGKYLIIEYIDGQSLEDIKKLHLTQIDKYSIILQIITVIQYLHNKHFIYRDLKPNNIMIDRNKNVVLIDFDQMIRSNSDEEQTKDFASNYIAPEINEKNLRESADIFSIGQIIYFIMNEKEPSSNALINLKDFDLHPEMRAFYLKCTKENPEERPSIKVLIVNFYNFIISNNIVLSHIYADVQLELAKFSMDINNYRQAILYFSLAAEQNQPEAQFNLGTAYLEGRLIKQDINKAIHYFSLSADKKQLNSLFNLGMIYMDNKFIPRDINKSIHYFTLAAELNHIKAQINLGSIYYNGEYIQPDVSKAIYYYSLASNNNDPIAQYNLGIIYYHGEHIKQDINKAIHYFTLSSNQNYVRALFNLGEIYYNKKYIPQNINKAIHYFTLASNQNDYSSQFYLGLIYMNENDINKAIYYFTLAANQNNAESQINLGKIYYDGNLVQRDIKKAIYYFTLASNQNREEACYHLGLIYYNNKYIQRDISKAFYYFSIAANQNNPDALFYLGTIYLEDNFLDIKKAIYYLERASEQNIINAQLRIGLIYYEGKYIQRDIDKSIHYFQLASNQNSVEANFNLGVIYHLCKYINHDINKAIYYYSLAAEKGFPYALNNLGYIYLEGQYVTRDINKAIFYYQKAADLYYPYAQFNLGSIYNEGKYVKRDIKKAIHYFTLASKQKDFKAQFELGMIYLKGQFVEKNINKAIYYITLSSDQNYPLAQLKLGAFYYEGKIIKRDINRAIHYLTLAANQNQRNAQFILGSIYYDGTYIKQNIQQSLSWFKQSSENKYTDSIFVIGYFYHEGKHVKQDINESIHYYKDASSFNNNYAKNNLGILYKNGFGDEIHKNLELAEIYFKEAIRMKNDAVSMYNLSHIYIYEYSSDKYINEAIDLLIKSVKLNFGPSKILLCLVLFQRYHLDIENIKLELKKSTEITDDIINTFEQLQLCFLIDYETIYQQFKEIDYLYNPLFQHLISSSLCAQKKSQKADEIESIFNITSHFYEGFGVEV